jgi:hypothetical protein
MKYLKKLQAMTVTEIVSILIIVAVPLAIGYGLLS